jgi:hypothetical protein
MPRFESGALQIQRQFYCHTYLLSILAERKSSTESEGRQFRVRTKPAAWNDNGFAFRVCYSCNGKLLGKDYLTGVSQRVTTSVTSQRLTEFVPLANMSCPSSPQWRKHIGWADTVGLKEKRENELPV